MTTRSEFLKRSAKLVTGALATALDAKIPVEAKSLTLSIFPPGAVSNFDEVCTACGDCLPVCPEQAIQIRRDEKADTFLPTIRPAIKACVMCQETPCISACEEKALVRPEDDIFPKIGLAVVVETACIAHQGNACLVCYDACPLKRSALKMKLNRPVSDSEYCTGCGICENVCIVEGEKGIQVKVV